jgi:hypothetical protein
MSERTERDLRVKRGQRHEGRESMTKAAQP